MAGSMKRRGDSWWLVVSNGFDPVTGKRRQVTRTFKGSERAASKELSLMVAEVHGGEHDGTVTTVAALLDRWLPIAKLGPATRADYTTIANLYLRPNIGTMRLDRLRAHHLDSLYGKLGREGMKADRARKVHTVIRSALNQAVRWRWVTANVAFDAQPPSATRPRIDPPSPHEVRLILKAAKAWTEPHEGKGRPATGAIHAFLLLAIATGARRGELCGLQWDNLDLVGGHVVIQRSITAVKGGWQAKEPKTRRFRVIALDTATAAALTAWKESAAESEWVFPARDSDGPMRPAAVSHLFHKITVAAGSPTVRLHDLRHYVATQLVASGMDSVTVATRLGHSRPSTTLDIYSAFLPARDREAAEVIARINRGD